MTLITEKADGAAPTPLSRALDAIKKLRTELDAARAAQPVAVVGVGLRMPGSAASLADYWAALADGRDLVGELPAHRMAPFAAAWRDLPRLGGFLDQVLDFDADFFGISDREARCLDPQQRLLLEVCWEALEDAALPPTVAGFPATTGCFVGVTNYDYRDWCPAESGFLWGVGNHPSYAAGRIAFTLGLTGPAMTVDTACSSSLVAVHLARQALARGECEVALAAAVNLILSPNSTKLIAQSGLLAADGRCKPFDAAADGFTRSEGCGVLVLKRLSDALRDRDRIHAVLTGSAVNQDGRSASITAPNPLSQVALFRAALADAGLRAADIGLVEAHGTGTALGDPIEIESMITGLDRGPHQYPRTPLLVSAVKANIGHLESAAGMAGLIKAMLSVRLGLVPPVPHLRTLNPRIVLDGTGIQLPTDLMPWPRDAGRYAAVSSFGMSGTNAQVIVGPAPDKPAADGRVPVRGFELTARTVPALRELAGRYHDRLETVSPEDFSAFAYTATHGRARHAVRARVEAAQLASARAALHALADGTPSAPVTVIEAAAVAGTPADNGERLPRAVLDLPHYPWQRRHHAVEPEAAAEPESLAST